jgi:hypothetical protein
LRDTATSAATIGKIGFSGRFGRGDGNDAGSAFSSSPQRRNVDFLFCQRENLTGPGTRQHPPGDEMPHHENGATDNSRTSKSRLSDSLLRLHRTLEQSRSTEQSAELQFRQWQERWSSRKEQISRRLELIDKQLERLVQINQVNLHPVRPQLSVVAAPGYEEERALM